MRFFNYTSEFVPWLVETFPLSTFVDIGCGEGHLVQDILRHIEIEGTGGSEGSAKLKVRGYALGVDKWASHDPVLDGYILEGDSTTPKVGTLLQAIDCPVYMFCRPCHGDFVAKTLEETHPERAIYIGRASKAPQDLGKWFAKFKQIEAPGLLPTEDGEPLVMLTYTASFYTTRDPVAMYDLDRRRRWLAANAPAGMFGWVSPQGAFVSCHYWQHDLLAHLMGYSPRLFECLGWGRLTVREGEGADSIRPLIYTQDGELSFDTVTDMQAITIEALRSAWEQNPAAAMAAPVTSEALSGVR